MLRFTVTFVVILEEDNLDRLRDVAESEYGMDEAHDMSARDIIREAVEATLDSNFTYDGLPLNRGPVIVKEEE